MAAGLRVGLNCKLYYNSATYGSPTWAVVTIAQDVGLNLTQSLAEVKSRVSAWIRTLPAMKSADLEFSIIADTSATPYNVLRDAWVNGTLMDFAIADDAIATTGTDYFRGEYYIETFAPDQKLEEAQTVKITAKLGHSSNAPAWTDVT